MRPHGPEEMLWHHKAVAGVLSLAMLVGLPLLGFASWQALAQGPDYCGIVKEKKCSATKGGEWVLVTAGNSTYVVLMKDGKSVTVQKIQ